MKNVNQLEKERREVLRNMKEEEIIKLYENLSEELVSYYWSYKNNFSGNPEGINRLKNRLKELDSDLKDIYKTDVLFSSSMIKTLAKEFDETNTEVLRLIYKNELLEFISYLNVFEYTVYLLNMVLLRIYLKHEHKYYFDSNYKLVSYVEEKFNLDYNKEEDLAIISDINEKAYEINKEYHEESFERDIRPYNSFIQILIEMIELIIKEINEYLERDFEVYEDTIEELVPVLEGLIRIQDKAKEELKEYEELKLNPFKEAIKFNVNFNVEHTNKRNKELNKEHGFNFKMLDYDEELAKAIANAPKYDFEKFELIEPEGVESDEEC